ncbi:FAD binding domain-containing protein [Radiomyces spectabilis]|uniref:FAD binding domain-containing protein n=1 Tax=Radiomyces spectabilis TaxID=64574 RepID=UPI002220FDD9|nr:FAD binding domain-containing protein [Radiomyces spectabilis]KAI8364647.1 FAD binding domain-containing protein [Radiomyces spectabilis]
MALPNQIIVVGGGLSGLAAAHTVVEQGGNVLLLDKNPFFGGNSTKATSGINGALTRTQIAAGIKDSVEQFYEDTIKSARDLARPDLISVLTGHSASAVHWLQEQFKLDLSLVSRLGGHSMPRTHRGKEQFPGMTITYALMEELEDLAKKQPSRVRIIKKARVEHLIQGGKGDIVGVEYRLVGKGKKLEDKVHKEYGPVILATGGYAADFGSNSLLQKYRPEFFDLSTTNGDHCTGDGIKMADAIGANTIDLEKVQVHPTGLVDPEDPDSKVKFLAAEALRGCGGLLLNADGERFCDELGHRDYVTGEMWKTKFPIRLVLGTAASKEIEWHCRHYAGRGLMKKFENGEALAKEMGIPAAKLKETFETHKRIAEGKMKDPWGKRFFSNVPTMSDQFYVALMQPVLHYTMGGVEINTEAEIKGRDGKPIRGLFAAGEMCGGVHGANRLGGSSLLGCVVFGRVAGRSASRYQFQHLLAGQSNGATVGEQLTQKDPNRVSLEIAWPGANARSDQQEPTAASTAASTHPAGNGQTSANTEAPKEKEGERKPQTYGKDEVAKHNKADDCWVVVNGKVLDVTNFLDEHPGGKKAILLYAGRDASEEFNMLHKPDVVEKYAPESIIGTYKKE